MQTLGLILLGMLGGCIPIFNDLYRLRTQGPPIYIRSVFYWIMEIIMVLAGGGIVYVYIATGSQLNPMLAINIGATAPLIIKQFASKKIDISDK